MATLIYIMLKFDKFFFLICIIFFFWSLKHRLPNTKALIFFSQTITLIELSQADSSYSQYLLIKTLHKTH